MVISLQHIKQFFGIGLVCIGSGVLAWSVFGQLRLPLPWSLFQLPASFLCMALVPAGKVWLREWRSRRRALQNGAELAPQWKGQRIGSIDLMIQLIEGAKEGYPGDPVFSKVSELGGLIDVYSLWEHVYFACDPEIIKRMTSTAFADFPKGDALKATLQSVLGDGVFNSDGEMWKFHRSMARPFFTHDRIRDLDLLDRLAQHTIKKLTQRLRAGYAVDFQDLISRFTLDASSEFLFGHCIHNLEDQLPYAHDVAVPVRKAERTAEKPVATSQEFARAFAGAQEVAMDRVRLRWMWPFKEILVSASDKHMRVVDSVLDPIVDEALRKYKQTENRSEEKDSETLLEHLVKSTDDPKILHDAIMNMMLAGRDTTASTLTFAVYLLCEHPAVLERLREEVLQTVGPTARPAFEDIKEMKYLRAVLNETLRLYPPVPWDVRTTARDVTLPNPDPNGKPFFVPGQSMIYMSPVIVHRRKELWGPDALEFDPDRFLDERMHKYLVPNPFIFFPFNAGPRICLGQQFAYHEMSLFLVRLLQSFSHMTFDLDAQPPESRPPESWKGAEGRKGKDRILPKCHLVMYSDGGLWVRMTEA